MAIVKACLLKNKVGNTGKECDTSMEATSMLIAVPPDFTFTDDDLEDPDSWINTALHAAQGSRIVPLFGLQAPIRTITNSQEGDVTVTLDDGLIVFLRYGLYNRTFETTSGGLCYAESLQSLNKSGYRILEIDQSGKMLARDNKNGTYSGLIIDFMYAPSPILPDFKSTPYKNRFQYTLNPQEMVKNGVILEGASSILSIMGLIDSEITKAAAATTTILKIGVRTHCAQADLVAKFTTDLAQVENFVVTNKATGVVVTPSAAAIVSGHIELTGTYGTGLTFNVKGAEPSVWLGNTIEGYDAEDGGIDIVIP